MGKFYGVDAACPIHARGHVLRSQSPNLDGTSDKSGVIMKALEACPGIDPGPGVAPRTVPALVTNGFRRGLPSKLARLIAACKE